MRVTIYVRPGRLGPPSPPTVALMIAPRQPPAEEGQLRLSADAAASDRSSRSYIPVVGEGDGARRGWGHWLLYALESGEPWAMTVSAPTEQAAAMLQAYQFNVGAINTTCSSLLPSGVHVGAAGRLPAPAHPSHSAPAAVSTPSGYRAQWTARLSNGPHNQPWALGGVSLPEAASRSRGTLLGPSAAAQAGAVIHQPSGSQTPALVPYLSPERILPPSEGHVSAMAAAARAACATGGASAAPHSRAGAPTRGPPRRGRPGSSQYQGVSWAARCRKWRVQLWFARKVCPHCAPLQPVPAGFCHWFRLHTPAT